MTNSDPMFDPILAALPRDLRPAEMLYRAPGAFLENLAFDPDGSLYVTSLYGREVLRWKEGEEGSVFSKLDIHPMSLSAISTATGIPGASSAPSVRSRRGLCQRLSPTLNSSGPRSHVSMKC